MAPDPGFWEEFFFFKSQDEATKVRWMGNIFGEGLEEVPKCVIMEKNYSDNMCDPDSKSRHNPGYGNKENPT